MRDDFLDRIKALMDLKRYNQAIKMCLKHLYSASEDVDVLYYYLIQSYWNLDDYKKMEKFVKEALAKFPEDDDFYRLYSQVFFHKKMYDEAIKYIDKALKFNSSSALCYYTKAQILNCKEEYKEAKKCILKALKEDSDDVDYLYTYAEILYNQSDEKYKEIIEQILRIDPHNADAIALRGDGESLWKRKFYFLKALKLNPFDKEIQTSLKENKLELLAVFVSVVLSLAIILLNIYQDISYGANVALFCFLGVCFYILAYHPSLIFFFTYIVAFYFLYDSSARLDSTLVVLCCAAYSYLFWGLLRNCVKNIIDFFIGFKNSLEYKEKLGLKELIFSNLGISIYFLLIAFYLSHVEYKFISWILFALILVFIFGLGKELTTQYLDDKIVHLAVYSGFLYFSKVVSNVLFEVCQKLSLEFLHVIIIIPLVYIFVITSVYEKDEDEEEKQENLV